MEPYVVRLLAYLALLGALGISMFAFMRKYSEFPLFHVIFSLFFFSDEVYEHILWFESLCH